MKIGEFISQYSDEQSCKIKFKEIRDKEGIICKRCSNTSHYWLKTKEIYECKQCKFRTSLRSGTIMENSRLSFSLYFLLMFLMTATKKGLSSCEMKRQLGHKRYATIWSIMHRIRIRMGQRDDRYQLQDFIEFDEAYFEKATKITEKKNLKRGKGSQKQSLVAVMAESVPIEDIETGEIGKSCRYFKMKVIESGKQEQISKVISENTDKKAIIHSDKSTSYQNLHKLVEVHISEKSNSETTNTTLKWIHTAIANAKRTFLGIYHKIDQKYLQNYLNEFVYKLNRRYFKSIFSRLLYAVV